jgi:hypothetical protein
VAGLTAALLNGSLLRLVPRCDHWRIRRTPACVLQIAVTIATAAAQRGSGRFGPSHGLLDAGCRSWPKARLIGPYLGQPVQRLGTVG